MDYNHMPVLHMRVTEASSFGSHCHCHITTQVNNNGCCGSSLKLQHPLNYMAASSKLWLHVWVKEIQS